MEGRERDEDQASVGQSRTTATPAELLSLLCSYQEAAQAAARHPSAVAVVTTTTTQLVRPTAVTASEAASRLREQEVPRQILMLKSRVHVPKKRRGPSGYEADAEQEEGEDDYSGDDKPQGVEMGQADEAAEQAQLMPAPVPQRQQTRKRSRKKHRA